MRRTHFVLVLLLLVVIVWQVSFFASEIRRQKDFLPYLWTSLRSSLASDATADGAILLYMRELVRFDLQAASKYLVGEMLERHQGAHSLFSDDDLEGVEEHLISLRVLEKDVSEDGSIAVIRFRAVIQSGYKAFFEVETTEWEAELILRGADWRLRDIKRLSVHSVLNF